MQNVRGIYCNVISLTAVQCGCWKGLVTAHLLPLLLLGEPQLMSYIWKDARLTDVVALGSLNCYFLLLWRKANGEGMRGIKLLHDIIMAGLNFHEFGCGRQAVGSWCMARRCGHYHHHHMLIMRAIIAIYNSYYSRCPTELVQKRRRES